MRRRSMFADPPPEDAAAHGSIRWTTSELAGRFYVKMWQGKQSRPFAHYAFRTQEQRQEWIDKQISYADATERAKVTQRAERDQALQKMIDTVQVGTILHYSWGYEQTQCEYYQVVSKSGRRLTIRRIGSETIPGSEGFMSDSRRPRKDGFLADEPPIVKIIGAYGITMDHGTATPCSEDAKNYCSWYY